MDSATLDEMLDATRDEMLDAGLHELLASLDGKEVERKSSGAKFWDDMSKEELVESLSFLTINTMFPEHEDGKIVASNWFKLYDKAVELLQKIIQINSGLQEQCLKHIGLEHAAITFMLDRLRDMRIYCEASLSSDSEGEGKESEEEVDDLEVDDDDDNGIKAKDIGGNEGIKAKRKDIAGIEAKGNDASGPRSTSDNNVQEMDHKDQVRRSKTKYPVRPSRTQ